MYDVVIGALFGLLLGWVLWGPKPRGFFLSETPEWPQEAQPEFGCSAEFKEDIERIFPEYHDDLTGQGRR
jgi:hypothetical protein